VSIGNHRRRIFSKNLGRFLGSAAHCLMSSGISRQFPKKEPPMQLFSWLHKRLTDRAHTGHTLARKLTPRFRPELEVLEGRVVPSTLKVTNSFDNGPGSLRYEIALATGKDTIVFDRNLNGQAIALTSGELVLTKNVTIKGPGAGALTITSMPWINALGESEPGSRVFEVDGGNTTVAISGLTISNAGGTVQSGTFGPAYDGWGGAILNYGKLTVSACTLSNDSARYGGGAIANYGTLTLGGSTISGSFGDYSATNLVGGAIYNAGAMTVYNSTISGRAPGSGGELAIYGGAIFNIGNMQISSCTLTGNYAAQDGGAIYNSGTMSVSTTTVSDDHLLPTGVGGAGIYNQLGGQLYVNNSVFSSNTPDNIYGLYTDGGGNTFR
jgi:predicted outer membrane repeat protein